MADFTVTGGRHPEIRIRNVPRKNWPLAIRAVEHAAERGSWSGGFDIVGFKDGPNFLVRKTVTGFTVTGENKDA